MFDLVADVESYPRFLPWCRGARILDKKGPVWSAELAVGAGPLRERFVSEIHIESPHLIETRGIQGPFTTLDSQWRFTPTTTPDGCKIDFCVDFSFRSRLLNGMMDLFFDQAFRRMVEAFEQRAEAIYNTQTGRQ